MIIGSDLIDYGRAALIEELLSAGQWHRKCGNVNVFPDAQGSVAFCKMAAFILQLVNECVRVAARCR